MQLSNLNQTAAPLRRQLKQNENRMRAIAQIKDAAAVHAKLKPIHDTFIKKNFKLTKDAYAAQHKDELESFNKAVRTLMKLNGSTAVDFSALDAEFSALQSEQRRAAHPTGNLAAGHLCPEKYPQVYRHGAE